MARQAEHNTVESYLSIPINYLNRQDMLRPGQYSLHWTLNGEPSGDVRLTITEDTMTITYRWRRSKYDEWSDASVTVQLTSTPVHLGGSRPWFLCPECGRRCGVLYLNGSSFGCRTCLNLRYTSQREQPLDRAIRRRGKYEDKIGYGLHDNKTMKQKPKGMHWHTYDRLLQKALAADQKMLAELGRQIGVMQLRW